jgi:Cu-processing system permease protein
MSAVLAISRKEVRDAISSRWLVLYAAVFAVLALSISYIGQRNLGEVGFENFSRTTAGILNLCLIMAPLMAVALGAGAIAGERERGTLNYLLAQPISRLDLILGKFTGLVLAVGLATVAGFGAAGVVIALFAESLDAGTYLMLMLLVLALVAVMTGIGLLASVVSSTRAQAFAVALLVWFAAVLLFDLLLVGLVTSASVGGSGLLALLLLNPVEIVRVLAIIHLEPDLEVLGPFGAYILEEFGTGGATAVLLVALAAWLAVPLGLAAWLFNRSGA